MIPRTYQAQALTNITAGWNEYQRQLLVMATGTGKTIVIAHEVEREVNAGGKVLLLAHYNELLEQAQDKLWLATGMASALEKGASSAADSWLPVVVASMQSLHKKRLLTWPDDTFSLVIVDEAHHALSNSYKAILKHFNQARVLGVTATPDRGDKKSLAEVFESIPFEYSLRQGIQDGFLCPIRAEMVPIAIDMNAVRTVAGDFSMDDAGDAIEPSLDAVARELASVGKHRKTLAFLPLIRTSQAFAEACRAHGLNAVHVDGTDKDRETKISLFASGDIQVLCNSSLLLEGYDCPDIDCICILRPTQSRALYAQMVGRGTRTYPTKKDLLLLDFLWQTEKHSLCVPASLIAKTKEQAKEMSQYIVSCGSTDILDAERDAQAAREKKLTEEMRKNKSRKRKAVNPLEWAVTVHDTDLQDYEPVMKWEAKAPSEKQLQLIEKFGLSTEEIRYAGQASRIIGKLIARRKENLCTPKQARLLLRNNIDPANMTFDEASACIDTLTAGWKAAG